MKSKSKIHLISVIWGLLVTSFMLLAVGSKIITGIFEDAPQYIIELQESFSDPLAPTLYFFTYIIGYIVIWWKPLWGSIIIILVSIYYVIVAGFDGPPVFAAPGFLVGALYLTDWFIRKRNQTKTA